MTNLAPPLSRIMIINDSLGIQKLFSIISLNNHLFQSIEANLLTVSNQFIKWFSPSLDYPCIQNPYYLFAPFKIFWNNHAGIITPYFCGQEEQGERSDIIEAVKTTIAQTTISAFNPRISDF